MLLNFLINKRGICMKKLLLFFSSFFAVFLLFSSNNVNAATYGRGSKVTVPKSYRGTWYSHDSGLPSKITFTAHTLNEKTIYRQNAKVAEKLFVDVMLSHKKAKQISKATKNWNAGSFSTFKGKQYLEVDSWVTFESWHLYRPVTVTIDGKKTKILAYTTRYSGGNYYRTNALAKKMKNHKFNGIKYY